MDICTFGFNGSGGGIVSSLTAADNGLSVVAGTTVVLGQDVGQSGDPGQLVSAREVPLNGFSINFLGSSASNNLKILDSGSVLIGTTTDMGSKLQVEGNTYVSGVIRVNTGNILNNSVFTYISNWGGSAGFIGFGFSATSNPSASDSIFDIYQCPDILPSDVFKFKNTFSNSVGNSTAYAIISIETAINQTNGSNGVMRGIFYNPTITSLIGEHRAIETVIGDVFLGTTSGSVVVGPSADGSVSTSAAFQVRSVTKGILFPRMTTTQRDAIPSPTGGLVIYNTSTNKLNLYTTAWEALTSG